MRLRSRNLLPRRAERALRVEGLPRWKCLTQDADVVRVDEVRCGPAVQVVFRHAGIGERLPLCRLPRRIRAQNREASDLLVTTGVVDLVQLVARAKLAADRVP